MESNTAFTALSTRKNIVSRQELFMTDPEWETIRAAICDCAHMTEILGALSMKAEAAEAIAILACTVYLLGYDQARATAPPLRFEVAE